MKFVSFAAFLIVGAFVEETLAVSYPTSKTNGMVGFAKKVGVTGGWSGGTLTINTLAELQKYVGDSVPRVLVISRDITSPTPIKVILGANKSIIGSYGSRTLYNIHFRDAPSTTNIIFQNLIFQHSKDIKYNDAIQIHLDFGNKYWIDHCSFVGHSASENDGSLDKLLYIGDKADYATISNCYFGNHKYGVIMGHPEDDNSAAYNGYPRVTMCHNHFENVLYRAPGRFRYGYFHIYNNYINNYELGFTVGMKAKVLSEHNVFGSGSGSTLDDKGLATFLDTGSNPITTNKISPKSTWTAISNYAYTLKAPAQVKAFTSNFAGARSTTLVFGS